MTTTLTGMVATGGDFTLPVLTKDCDYAFQGECTATPKEKREYCGSPGMMQGSACKYYKSRIRPIYSNRFKGGKK